VAGLYDSDSKYRLSHQGNETVAPVVAELTVEPREIAAVPVPVEGWYPMASQGDEPFHWTRGRAAVLFRNPASAAILHLSAQSVVNLAGGSQTIVVRVEGHVVDRFEITHQDRFTRRYRLSPDILGDEAQIRVALEVFPTFVPAQVTPGSPDDRELGIRVFTLFLAPEDDAS